MPLDEPHQAHFDYSLNDYHFSYSGYTPISSLAPDYISGGDYDPAYNVIQFSGAYPLLGPNLPMPVDAFTTNDVTVEMWIAFTSKASTTIPIVGVNGRSFYSGFEVGYNGPANILWCHFSDTYDSNPSIKAVVNIQLLTWTHIACVDSYTISKGQLLVNSQALTNTSYYSFSPATAFPSSSYLVLGRRTGTMTDTMTGYIREFRMWNSPLDGWRLKALMHQ